MANLIEVTVVSINGRVSAAGATQINTSRIDSVIADTAGALISYDKKPGKLEGTQIIVSETPADVTLAANAALA